MRKFKYIARNAKGYVEFQTPDGPVRMETGEAVDVPDSLAKKLEHNNHFEEVKGSESHQEKGERDAQASRRPQAEHLAHGEKAGDATHRTSVHEQTGDHKTHETETGQSRESIERGHEKKVAERHPEELARQEHPIPSDDKKTHRGR